MKFNDIESGKTYKSSGGCLYYVRTVVSLVNGGKRVYCDGMNGEHLGSIPESIWSTFQEYQQPEIKKSNATGILSFNIDDSEGIRRFKRASCADDLFRAVWNIREDIRKLVKYEQKEAFQEAYNMVNNCLSDASIDLDNLYC
jgi:hypothetical protein